MYSNYCGVLPFYIHLKWCLVPNLMKMTLDRKARLVLSTAVFTNWGQVNVLVCLHSSANPWCLFLDVYQVLYTYIKFSNHVTWDKWLGIYSDSSIWSIDSRILDSLHLLMWEYYKIPSIYVVIYISFEIKVKKGPMKGTGNWAIPCMLIYCSIVSKSLMCPSHYYLVQCAQFPLSSAGCQGWHIQKFKHVLIPGVSGPLL